MNPELSTGSEGEWVTYLQQLLEAAGYDTGPIDAIFGPITEAAVQQFQADYGLKVDGIVGPITWPEVEGGGGSSEPAEATRMEINQTLQLVPQPTELSCWAAGIAMLVDKSPEDVASEAGMNLDDGYGWSDIQNAVSCHGLTEIGPACGGPDYFAPMLEKSPLWIVEIAAPAYHAVVLAGLNGGGNWDDTDVTIYNPWPPNSGAIETKSFEEFANEYELGAGAMAQIVSR